MCVAAYIKKENLEEAGLEFGLEALPEAVWNRVRIEEKVPVIRKEGSGGNQWATPFWAAKRELGNKALASFNVRIEKLQTHALWGSAYGRRHCLLFCSGFFERQGKCRPPRYHYFSDEATPTLALAGLWDGVSGEDSDRSMVTILTKEASPSVSVIHSRMPVILEKPQWSRWLQAEMFLHSGVEEVLPIFSGSLVHWPVTTDLFRHNLSNDEKILEKRLDESTVQIELKLGDL